MNREIISSPADNDSNARADSDNDAIADHGPDADSADPGTNPCPDVVCHAGYDAVVDPDLDVASDDGNEGDGHGNVMVVCVVGRHYLICTLIM